MTEEEEILGPTRRSFLGWTAALIAMPTVILRPEPVLFKVTERYAFGWSTIDNILLQGALSMEARPGERIEVGDWGKIEGYPL